ncbi:hypothetical protein K502DRAFT_353590 [Neoconidiobolus thromboides FSU 785]|nr:hypothetical protein K502DRAFT_353590 [Neoconidiobolus thromboides FSU 785]
MVSNEYGCDNVITRVTIVNSYEYTIFDKYVEPTHNVTDYCIRISDIQKGGLNQCFKVARQDVLFLIKNRMLVGHKVFKDLEALKINHPLRLRKETATLFLPSGNIDQRISIKNLCFNLFDIKILEGCHNTYDQVLELDCFRQELEQIPLNSRALLTERELELINEDRQNPINEEDVLAELLSTKFHLNEEYLSQYHYALAIDCEMVGGGSRGSITLLARVSIVNYYGYTIFDKYVAPTQEVTDYRTWVSGIKEEHLRNAPSFEVVQQHVLFLIKGKVLVGHSIRSDLKALKIDHPAHLRVDTTTPISFGMNTNKVFSLKTLCYNLFNVGIQNGSHSSEIDALATMAIYRKFQHFDSTMVEALISTRKKLKEIEFKQHH